MNATLVAEDKQLAERSQATYIFNTYYFVYCPHLGWAPFLPREGVQDLHMQLHADEMSGFELQSQPVG